jgi:hypothetical protein
VHDTFVGTRTGMLEVIGVGEPYYKPNGDYGCARYRVKCECGKEKDMTKGVILKENTISCGCYSAKLASTNGKNRKTHGKTKTLAYKTWVCMKSRCYNQKNPSYGYYGAIGVKVCDRWLDSFENFVADMGERPKDRTIDRINPIGDYCPENCRWATPKEQADNRRTTKLRDNDKTNMMKLFRAGEKRKDIAIQYGISYSYICQLLSKALISGPES